VQTTKPFQMYKEKIKKAQKICQICFFTIFIFSLQACNSSKFLKKLTQSQRISLLPSPLEMHGGNVKGSIRVAVPTKIIQKYKKKNYELRFYFSDYPYSQKGNYLLELGSINFEKSKLKEDEQIQEIDFEFPFQNDKNEGSVLAKGYYYTKKKQKSTDSYFFIGKGIIQTAALFREQQADTLLYLHLAQPHTTLPTLFVPFARGSWKLNMDNSKHEILEILAKNNQKIIVEASCSPEGEAEENLQLAQKRAESIKDYLKKIKNDVSVELQIHSLKEVKQEIIKLLDSKNFNPSQKQEIKNLLQNSQSLEGLEISLRKKPYYSQIVSDLYPSLRYVRLSVPDTTLQEPINYYQLLIDTESNPTAHHNLGLWYWQKYQKYKDSSDLQKSLYHLEVAANIEQKAETFFNLMTIYQKLRNSNKSEHFKTKLLATNSENTYLQECINFQKGLQVARKAQSSRDKKYKQALELFEKAGNNIEANTNKALAALLAHQYDKAVFYLEKNQDDALGLYLLAVVAARKGNEQEAINFLKKSLQKDEKLKLKAQKDLEFEFLRDNKNFLNLVK